jgi:hypothetical protein
MGTPGGYPRQAKRGCATRSKPSYRNNFRLNPVQILGNVIDNTTVCTPLAHLNDPALLESPNGINGRANLLGVISVVAPWAYKENFDNITRTTQAIKASIQDGDPNLRSTSASLANIDARLLSQTATSNKNVPMPEAWRSDCATRHKASWIKQAGP